VKNIITGVACLLLLSVFMVQFTSNQVTHSKMLYVETQVNTAVEEAKQEGCFTSSIVSSLKSKIAAKTGCSEAEVIITASNTPVVRGSEISYSVSYPLKGVIGASTLLGINAAQNTVTHTLSGTVISEYVRP